MTCVDALMKAGAQSVKIEGIDGHEEVIRHVIGSGVPVMGHIGLTPQSVHRFGGHRIQGRENGARQRLLEQALRVEDAGCYAVVLEAVPADAVGGITSRLHIPTIGIGAGSAVDGQILVLHDLLGLTADIRPKFVRRFLEGAVLFAEALNAFDHEVKAGAFPSDQESYQ
jgi:3-methyl-2-oxobutanoate hydroxymethyltransferase